MPASLRTLLAGAALAATRAEARPAVSWRSCGPAADKTAVAGTAPAPALAGELSLAACRARCEADDSCRGLHYHAASRRCALAASSEALLQTARGLPGAKCWQREVRSGPEVYVMLPLDTLAQDGRLKDKAGTERLLDGAEAETAGADGFMVDVWWGLTEPIPKVYRFAAYKELLAMAKARGFKVQCVASFHRCGGNAGGDDCNIPLPPFVHNADGIWYRDAQGDDNREYVSLWADGAKVGGRTPLEMYSDWFEAFAAEFREDLGGTISEVMVGMGPSGELRYPSYRPGKWRFCGVGAFQAFDPYAVASLKVAAAAAGHAQDWGSPPNTSAAGGYNSRPHDTHFFSGGYATEHGKFFLDWYSSSLKAHGAEVLARARAVFADRVRLSGKVAGIHWWYADPSHAAEVTAGYYNTNLRNAYAEIGDVFKAAGATLDFTCLEMRNSEQPADCLSRPEDLVRQVLEAGKEKGVAVSGENALQRYDDRAYSKILSYRGELEAFTYLRLGPRLLDAGNLRRFERFVARMHGGEGARRLAKGAQDEAAAPSVFV